MTNNFTLINTQESQDHLRERTIASAIAILDSELRVLECISAPNKVGQFVRLQLGSLERECFAVLFLNTQNKLVKYEPLFYGSVSSAKVEIREVARGALLNNASTVILAHNHPSGGAHFSREDILLTKTIKKSLEIFEINVVDHVLVAGGEVVSMAELDLM